jgi:23S rRNA pseudouridine955/2504/2580 synthase
MLRRGEVRVNGGRVRPTYRLEAADQLRIPPVHVPGSNDTGSVFIGDSLLREVERSIIFEDDQLLAINKPAGLAVHGGSGLSFGVIEVLRRLRASDQLGLAHRLDRDTSGCLLLAKSRPVLLGLHRALRDRQVKKVYSLVVMGDWPRRVTTVRLPLERFSTASGERRVKVSSAGKPSRTDFEIAEHGRHGTLLQARLHSGRTHQIRVHAQASGHAIAGDQKYAKPDQLALASELGVQRLCLHALELRITHQGRKLRLLAEPPDDFQEAWLALR